MKFKKKVLNVLYLTIEDFLFFLKQVIIRFD